MDVIPCLRQDSGRQGIPQLHTHIDARALVEYPRG